MSTDKPQSFSYNNHTIYVCAGTATHSSPTETVNIISFPKKKSNRQIRAISRQLAQVSEQHAQLSGGIT